MPIAQQPGYSSPKYMVAMFNMCSIVPVKSAQPYFGQEQRTHFEMARPSVAHRTALGRAARQAAARAVPVTARARLGQRVCVFLLPSVSGAERPGLPAVRLRRCASTSALGRCTGTDVTAGPAPVAVNRPGPAVGSFGSFKRPGRVHLFTWLLTSFDHNLPSTEFWASANPGQHLGPLSSP